MSEEVLVVHGDVLKPYLGCFEGGVMDWHGPDEGEKMEELLREITRPGVAAFLPRDAAEADPTHKQLIPYCVVTTGSGKDVKMFRYRRTRQGSEGRLHGKYSIGVGGHVNRCDGDDPYFDGLWRELKEELGVSPSDARDDDLYAVIYDDTDDVGRVHLGLVHWLHLRSQEVATEPTMAECEWVPYPGILSEERDYENWSRLLVARMRG